MKNNGISQNKGLVRSVVVVYIFENHFNVCVNRRWLYSHICFCFQSVGISSSGSLWNTPTYENTSEKVRVKKKPHLTMSLVLTLQNPRNGLEEL